MSTENCGCASKPCDCCQGTQPLTPMDETNRPGLPALRYRAGTHGAFFETMKARLASLSLQVPSADGQATLNATPLANLTTRDPSDFSIALLDGWASVADVLTFYQERIANEGFLRTATERRSILELARLVGYKLRPGVAASAFLAYTLDDNQATPVDIPAGSRSQSVPGPGELPQTFETSEQLTARREWNTLKPRLTEPQLFARTDNGIDQDVLYVQGASANLRINDPLLFDFGSQQILLHVKKAEPDFDNNWTKVTLREADVGSAGFSKFKDKGNPPAAIHKKGQATTSAFEKQESIFSVQTLRGLVEPLSVPTPPQLASSAFLARSVADALDARRDTIPALLGVFEPHIADTLYSAWRNATVIPPQPVKVYALRLTSSLFGANSPPRFIINHDTGEITGTDDWPVSENATTVDLDGAHDDVAPDSWVVVQTQDTLLTSAGTLICQPKSVTSGLSRSDYGSSAKITRVELPESSPWLNTSPGSAPRAVISNKARFAAIRKTIVLTQSEELTLTQRPYQADSRGEPADVSGDTHELASVYDGLKSGRWVIFAGERTDVKDANGNTVAGVKGAELAMIAAVEQTLDTATAGDQLRTRLRLHKPLAYSYKRKTVAIYANVVKATHGETRHEALGNGDAAQPLQSFDLKQPPLTFVSAPTPSGAESTLQVYVNEVEWHESDTLATAGPRDRLFITQTDDAGTTSVIFGNGAQGARLPTGQGNVKAVYRNGIGRPGNVAAGQVTVLQSKPLGVKEVVNPLRASGGADKESRDDARGNAPLAVTSLGRLVSVQDYADFTRTFAGIGKARADHLSDGLRRLVHVTIAGAEDVPIDLDSDLYRNLLAALRRYGDPSLPVVVGMRELKLLLFGADIRLLPDYQWEPVSQAVRQALLEQFGFVRLDLAQPVRLSQVLAAVQAVEGVDYIDVRYFDAIGENFDPPNLQNSSAVDHIVDPLLALPARPPAARTSPPFPLLPAQLIYFSPQVPDTLVLNQIS